MKVQRFWASSSDPVHGLYVSLQTAKMPMAKTLTSNQRLDEQTTERHYGYYLHLLCTLHDLIHESKLAPGCLLLTI